MVHVDLCTNRSGSDNWTHQSCPHNPFLQHTAHVTQGEGQMVKRRGHDVTQKTHEMINKDKWGKSVEKMQRTQKQKRRKTRQKLTVITAPVDVDTAAVITGELSERETGWVCWRHKQHQKQSMLTWKIL